MNTKIISVYSTNEMFDATWFVATFGADVEASSILGPTLVPAQEFAISRYQLGKGSAFSHFPCR